MNLTQSQQYLQYLYQDVLIPGQLSNKMTETYGEVLFESVTKLQSIFSIHSKDVLYDLGSGIGKFLVQIFLQSEVKRCHGIEIQSDLHRCAMHVYEKILGEQSIITDQRKLYFSRADFLNVDWKESTILWIGSPCYSPRILEQIADKVSHQNNIRAILSLRPMLHLKKFRLHQKISLECTWDTSLCYIYLKI